MARAKKERAKYVAVIESLDQEGRGVAAVTVKSFSSRGRSPARKSNTRSTAANLLLN